MKIKILSLILVIMITSCIKKKDPYEATVLDSISHTRKWAVDGPKFEFVKMSWAEKCKYLSNYQDQNNLPKITSACIFSGEGFVPGCIYHLYTSSMSSYHPKLSESFLATKGGYLISTKTGAALNNLIYVAAQNFRNGEPFYFSLISDDKKTCNTVRIIPNPIEFVWSDEAHFEFIAKEPSFQLFDGEGKGFKPFEEFEYEFTSGNEILTSKYFADKDGKFSIGIFPILANQDGGIAYFIIKREAFPEECELQIFWGNAANLFINQDCNFEPKQENL